VITQSASSRIRQSALSPSGSARISALAAVCPFPRSPNAVMCARQRPTAGRPRLGSGRGLQGRRGIRRGSQRAHSHADGLATDRAAHSDCVHFSRCGRIRLVTGFRAIGPDGDDKMGFRQGLNVRDNRVHLALHQRAGSPFRYLPYRAIGPDCQRGFL
jgi:hypothetical protein